MINSMSSYIFVKRLVIVKNSQLVYDQTFTRGINIIRGDNGTGKSTIIDLIYYGLGAELSEWTSPSLSCDKVYLEAETNSGIYTLCRDIEENGKAPMYIFEDNYASSVLMGAKWLKYLNKRSKERHSYSQQLFDLMLLPQHKNNDYANLTMHQLLRLIYVDQITPSTKILRQDSNYDNANIRQAIGEYLLGLDNLDVHKLRQEVLRHEKELAKIDGELKAFYKLLGKNRESFRIEQLKLEIEKINERIIKLQNKKKEIRYKTSLDLDNLQKKRAANLLKDIENYTKSIEHAYTEKAELTNEIIDSTLFIQSIDYRIKSLVESQVTSESLGELSFKYCPACLSPIDNNLNHDACGLCKKNSDSLKITRSYIHMLNELNFQKRESKDILDSDKAKLEKIKLEIPSLETLLSSSKLSYNDFLQSNSSLESELSVISNKIGFAESQLETLTERLELSLNIEELITKKETLIVDISRIKDLIVQKKNRSQSRVEKVYSNLESRTLDLVKQDLNFETDFIHSIDFDFNFSRDRMLLNGKSKFSASSMVLLKNSFRLAVLLESTYDKSYRYPRLLLMDNIEDKGMMAERSQNFQNVLTNICSEIESPYQIILTTSMISPELNNSNYCRGKFYKRGTHTLEF